MRLVTYSVGPADDARAGVRVGHRVLDIEAASRVKGEPLPQSVKALLAAGRGAFARVQALAKAAATEARSFTHAMHEERAIRLLPPVPGADEFHCIDADPPGQGAKPARAQCTPALVFVVGRRALGVDEEDAMDHVAGVTLLVQVSGPGARSDAGRGPLGPEIVTLDELPNPHDLWITCSVNGEQRSRVNAADAFAKLPAALAGIARTRAVEPGDLLCPGAASMPVAAGDVVECALEGIMTLRATIASR